MTDDKTEKTETKGNKPAIKVYLKDAEGKMVPDSCISLWDNTSEKTGKRYLNGQNSNKSQFYVGFYSDEEA